MGKVVKIGAGQGFYGDALEPAVYIAEHSDVQYICFDTLAELTLAILQKDRQKDPTKGYTRDITKTMKNLIPYIKKKGIKLITNAGGINPKGAKDEIIRVAKELNITGLKIATVTGDDIHHRIDELQSKGILLSNGDTGEQIEAVKDKLLFANVYLGAQGIAEALRQGADIVLTGRTSDTAQFLGPLIYEFGWGKEEWNKLASGILVGHLLECSGQVSGGNFSGDWHNIEGFENIGYPIAEVNEDGSFVVTKTKGSGGRISIDTIKEQFLYEIHDPSAYITPDVIADFTTAEFEEIENDRVLITGVTGKPAPETLKALMGYPNGFLGQGMIGYSWPQALSKARKAEEIIRLQIKKLGIKTEDIHAEYLGYNSLHGPLAHEVDEDLINEVFLRMIIKTETKKEASKLARLFPPLALSGPPFVGTVTGLSPTRELLALWPTFIPRELIEENIKVEINEVNEYV